MTIIGKCFAAVLCGFPASVPASDLFEIKTCDELIALDAKGFLCVYEEDLGATYSYRAKFYEEGKFSTPKEGKYVARLRISSGTRDFRIEQNGRLLIHENRAWLTDGRIADFYRTDDGGMGQKVYLCDYINKKSSPPCNVAPDGEYVSKTNVRFKTTDGFLGPVCSYEPSWGCSEKSALVCENRD